MVITEKGKTCILNVMAKLKKDALAIVLAEDEQGPLLDIAVIEKRDADRLIEVNGVSLAISEEDERSLENYVFDAEGEELHVYANHHCCGGHHHHEDGCCGHHHHEEGCGCEQKGDEKCTCGDECHCHDEEEHCCCGEDCQCGPECSCHEGGECNCGPDCACRDENGNCTCGEECHCGEKCGCEAPGDEKCTCG
ncbi:MAG: hypothetical protein HUJ60_02495, partial [Bacilli bacterium]|nr:hypothetical protein [Bacilli bacterium]